MSDLLEQLFFSFTPLVLKLIGEWQKTHNTTRVPTIEELKSDYEETIDGYLTEGAAWRAKHPKA